MAANTNGVGDFHKAIQFALAKLGKPDSFVLKEQQYEILKEVVVRKKDMLCVLPTGYGKSLIYQTVGFISDHYGGRRGASHSSSMVLVVSPLNSLIEDQVEKLRNHINVAVLKHNADSTGDETSSSALDSVDIVFAHPEVIVNNKIFRSKNIKKRICTVVVDEAHLIEEWKEFRPAYGKLGVLGNYFPGIPIVGLTATATAKTQSFICDSLGLFDPFIVTVNPDRPNIYFASSRRKSQGDDKLCDILEPLVKQLKTERQNFPLTLVYGNLQVISECYMFFNHSMGKEQYDPPGVDCVAKNRMFTQYHAHYPDRERSRIVSELANNKSKLRILFVTIAFGIGVDISYIRRVVHIGVPYTMEEYLQEAGRCGRDGLPASATIHFNSFDISAARTQMTNVMRAYLLDEKCKREAILRYFGFPVPQRNLPIHTCCDNCKTLCDCDECIIDAAFEVDESLLAINVDTALRISQVDKAKKGLSEDKARTLLNRLNEYRLSLHGTGRSCVGGVSLATGFSIELIESIVANANCISSVEDLITGYPVFSADHAQGIYDILQEII